MDLLIKFENIAGNSTSTSRPDRFTKRGGGKKQVDNFLTG